MTFALGGLTRRLGIIGVPLISYATQAVPQGASQFLSSGGYPLQYPSVPLRDEAGPRYDRKVDTGPPLARGFCG